MNPFKSIVAALLALTCSAIQGGAATYYVATNGLDSNPGTMVAPFKDHRPWNCRFGGR